jgi:chromosome segregation ATPase
VKSDKWKTGAFAGEEIVMPAHPNVLNEKQKQPQPTPPKPWDKDVTNLVIADLKERAEIGAKKYGTRLNTNNGRDALIDAYQEAMDLVQYLRQEIEERKDANELKALYLDALEKNEALEKENRRLAVKLTEREEIHNDLAGKYTWVEERLMGHKRVEEGLQGRCNRLEEENLELKKMNKKAVNQHEDVVHKYDKAVQDKLDLVNKIEYLKAERDEALETLENVRSAFQKFEKCYDLFRKP